MRPKHWLWTVIPASAFTVTRKEKKERKKKGHDIKMAGTHCTYREEMIRLTPETTELFAIDQMHLAKHTDWPNMLTDLPTDPPHSSTKPTRPACQLQTCIGVDWEQT